MSKKEPPEMRALKILSSLDSNSDDPADAEMRQDLQLALVKEDLKTLLAVLNKQTKLSDDPFAFVDDDSFDEDELTLDSAEQRSSCPSCDEKAKLLVTARRCLMALQEALDNRDLDLDAWKKRERDSRNKMLRMQKLIENEFKMVTRQKRDLEVAYSSMQVECSALRARVKELTAAAEMLPAPQRALFSPARSRTPGKPSPGPSTRTPPARPVVSASPAAAAAGAAATRLGSAAKAAAVGPRPGSLGSAGSVAATPVAPRNPFNLWSMGATPLLQRSAEELISSSDENDLGGGASSAHSAAASTERLMPSLASIMQQMEQLEQQRPSARAALGDLTSTADSMLNSYSDISGEDVIDLVTPAKPRMSSGGGNSGGVWPGDSTPFAARTGLLGSGWGGKSAGAPASMPQVERDELIAEQAASGLLRALGATPSSLPSGRHLRVRSRRKDSRSRAAPAPGPALHGLLLDL